MAKKLTRKEIIREDSIQQTLSTTSSWVVQNQKLLIAGLAGLILAVFGVYQFQNYRASADRQAQARFSQALEIFHASVGDQEGEDAANQSTAAQTGAGESSLRFATEQEKYDKALSAFQEVIDRHSGSMLAEWSLYYQALSYQSLGQTDQGIEKLEAVITRSNHSEIKNLARNSLAQILISNNQTDQAIQHLQKILDEPSPNFPQQVVLMRLASSYEALGDTEKALEFYRRVTAEFPNSEDSRQATSRIQQLEPLQQEAEAGALETNKLQEN